MEQLRFPTASRNWVIEVDEEPVGLLTLLALPGGEVEIVTFGLIPSYQGQGLGGQALTPRRRPRVDDL